MDILLLNQRWFQDELIAAGHRVISVGMREVVDVRLPYPAITYAQVLTYLPADFHPEAIIFLDESSPCVIINMDQVDVPVIFYSVDAHHHLELHVNLANVFDQTLVAQKDYIPEFEKKGLAVGWMPLWASMLPEPSIDKQYGAVFVGTMRRDLNPARVDFFEALQKKAPITVMSGDWWKIFPFAEIVVNQTVKGDLNFRVFEAMGSGAMLLTEASGNGLLDLFQVPRHLMVYEKNNVDQAAQIINACLMNRPKMREVAAAGRAEILRAHTSNARAEFLLAQLKTLKKRRSPTAAFSSMANCDTLAWQLLSVDRASEIRALYGALSCADRAISNNEPLSEIHQLAFLRSQIKLHIALGDNPGPEQLLFKMCEAYPAQPALELIAARSLLNKGKLSDARARIEKLGIKDFDMAVKSAEKLVKSLFEKSSGA